MWEDDTSQVSQVSANVGIHTQPNSTDVIHNNDINNPEPEWTRHGQLRQPATSAGQASLAVSASESVHVAQTFAEDQNRMRHLRRSGL